jgi:hypothetical protein
MYRTEGINSCSAEFAVYIELFKVVIIRLDRIIQSFSLDCPIKSGNDGNNKLKTSLRSFSINNI